MDDDRTTRQMDLLDRCHQLQRQVIDALQQSSYVTAKAKAQIAQLEELSKEIAQHLGKPEKS